MINYTYLLVIAKAAFVVLTVHVGQTAQMLKIIGFYANIACYQLGLVQHFTKASNYEIFQIILGV